MNAQAVIISESGIQIQLEPNHAVPKKCNVFFNKKMKLNREFCLAALHVYSTTLSAIEHPVKCLDAFGATGITGLQWKRHLGNAVDVTINDRDLEVCREIGETAEWNGMRVTTSDLLRTSNGVVRENNDLDGGKKGASSCVDVGKGAGLVTKVGGHIPGDVVKKEVHVENKTTEDGDDNKYRNNIEVVCEDARVLMHQRQHHFIQLDPFGCTVSFLDATFHNVYSGGVVVVTATDVASLYGKCPRTLLRNYGARYGEVNLDCIKEVATRVLLAAVARAAVRCKKGICVLYCLAAEHFVQVCVRVCRGASAADHCIEQIGDVLHCRVCQETAIIPAGYIDEFYNLLSCQCHRKNGARTADIVGPLWKGDIFEADYVRGMLQSGKTLSLSSKALKLLVIMLSEAEYEKLTTADRRNTVFHHLSDENEIYKMNFDEKLKINDFIVSVDGHSDKTICSNFERRNGHVTVVRTKNCSRDIRVDSVTSKEGNYESKFFDEDVCTNLGCINKSKESDSLAELVLTSEVCDNISTKFECEIVKTCMSGDVEKTEQVGISIGSLKLCPRMFYVCMYRRHVVDMDFPRLSALIGLLQREGYCASPTHFDPQALRTNASQAQIIEVMKMR